MINSKNYWNSRFQGDWEEKEGRKQTAFFVSLAIENFPEWFIRDVEKKQYSIYDVGCALGDGTKLLADYFLDSNIVGSNFSENAINKAEQYYSNLDFICEDILNDFHQQFDVVFSSNVLEHFSNPRLVLKKMTKKAKKYIVNLIPFEEEMMMKEHLSNFKHKNIPFKINNFILSFYKEIECNNQYWNGKQLLFIYSVSNNDILENIKLESFVKDYRDSLEKSEEEKRKISKQLIEKKEKIKYFDKEKKKLLRKLNNENDKNDKFNKQLKQLKVELEKSEEEKRKINKQLIEKNNEIKWRKNEQNRLLDLLKTKKSKIRKILNYTNTIDNIFYNNNNILKDYKSNFYFKLYSLLVKFKHSSFKKQVKLLRKVISKMFGKSNNLNVKNYNPLELLNENHQIISNNISIIKEIINIVNEDKKYKLKPINNELNNEITTELLKSSKNEIYFGIEPLITIMLPVYNHSDLIDESIKSIQNQTYNNWELIILDDGSTDNLYDVLDKYMKDPRIKIYKQDNQKLPTALTNLHQLANGEFLTWTSADNIMDSNMLEVLSKELLKNPESVLVFGDVALIDGNGDFYSKNKYRKQNRDKKSPYILRLPRNTIFLGEELDNYINACFLYRNLDSKILNGEYGRDLTGLEDYDYWLRLQACGKITHVRNSKPLYYYRLHKNTMSEDLLKNAKYEHINRGQKLIEFNKKRKKWRTKRWTINFGNKISLEQKKKLNSILKQLPVNFEKKSDKLLRINPDLQKIKNGEVYVKYTGFSYKVIINDNANFVEKLELGKGCSINPLALKARYTKNTSIPYYEHSQTQNKSIVGFHGSMEDIDIDFMIDVILKNKNIFFVFVNLLEEQPKKFLKIQEECNNAVYLGERSFGADYRLYSSWDAVLIPYKKESININCMERSLVLAWSIGKWLFYPESITDLRKFPFTLPYGIKFNIHDPCKLKDPLNNEELLDKYIRHYSEKGRMKKLLNLCNAITQDTVLNRPHFGETSEKIGDPVSVNKDKSFNLDKSSLKYGWIGLWVDSLDKGGVEQVVAFLSKYITHYGIKIKILCSECGGEVANQLNEEGFDVKIFNSNKSKFRRFLKDDKPLLLSSHFVHQMLDVAHSLNIPIIESIHNMYGHFNEKMWEEERNRTQYFIRMIADSNMVKKFYEKWHTKIEENKIDVVGNAADPNRILGLSREIIRSKLGLTENQVVFLNIASFDARKNHLGLLKSFELFYQEVDQEALLILIANNLNPTYKDVVMKLLNELECKNNVLVYNYKNDIGSYLNAADVFVMPSYFEGWSIAATEAAYSGLPLIHTECGSGLELCGVNNNGGILVSNPIGDPFSICEKTLYDNIWRGEPQNTKELYEAMKKIFNNINVWRKKRSELKTRALNKFNYDNMALGYLKVFDKVLS